MAIVARAGTAWFETPLQTPQPIAHFADATSRAVHHSCVPGLRSALAAFCGNASVLQAASKAPRQSSPKGHGICMNEASVLNHEPG